MPPLQVYVSGITELISGPAAFIYQPLSAFKPEEFHTILLKKIAAHIREEYPEIAPTSMMRTFYSFIKPTDFSLTNARMYIVPAGTAYCSRAFDILLHARQERSSLQINQASSSYGSNRVQAGDNGYPI